jgi:hypothetical protein
VQHSRQRATDGVFAFGRLEQEGFFTLKKHQGKVSGLTTTSTSVTVLAMLEMFRTAAA